MSSRIEFEVRFRGQTQRAPARDPDSPFRILLCGDFSGRSRSGAVATGDSLATRRLVSVDVDNLHQALRRFGARVPLQLDDSSVPMGELPIESLDDFHPDTLCRKIASFELLCGLRRRLLDPRTAADTVQALSRDAGASHASGAAAKTAGAAEDQAAMLTRLLGAPASSTAPTQQSASGMATLDTILQRAVAGHVTPAIDPRQTDFLASVDHALGESMRRLLHSPPFQKLEASWRSLHWLVTNVGPDEDLKIVALDVTKEELANDLLNASTLDDSAIHRRITDGTAWSLIVGDYAFGPHGEDVSLLTALGVLSEAAGGPFVAAAEDALLGCRVPEDCSRPGGWRTTNSEAAASFRALRTSSAALYLGLTWPRWLLRSPYGAKRDPVESFAFEEVKGPPAHLSLLWGNAAFAAAAMIAAAFREDAAAMPLEDVFEIGDLPLYVFDEGGESTMQPCTECWLTEEGWQAVLARGVMPIVSVRGRNAVRLVRVQSMADPALPLAGLGES
jgi:type VI secretion system protein ImpC